MRTPLLLIGAAAALAAAWAASVAAGEQARELGRVRWHRDFEAAKALARESERPMFVLFQEVPGCSTCVGFGETVLSDPLMVEAVETEFVPVAVLNNRPGADREVLERYGEPAWNNPVVRLLDTEGRDLIPRADGIWTPHGIATRMLRALREADRAAPAYLELVAWESAPRRRSHAVFATHCFWEGEACAGVLPGVLSTKAGWLDGREVVEVGFDPETTSYADLLRALREGGCASAVYARDEGELRQASEVWGTRARLAPGPVQTARDSDQKRYLRGARLEGLRALDLTPLQRTRVNAALGLGRDPLRWLSPRQRERVRASRG